MNYLFIINNNVTIMLFLYSKMVFQKKSKSNSVCYNAQKYCRIWINIKYLLRTLKANALAYKKYLKNQKFSVNMFKPRKMISNYFTTFHNTLNIIELTLFYPFVFFILVNSTFIGKTNLFVIEIYNIIKTVNKAKPMTIKAKRLIIKTIWLFVVNVTKARYITFTFFIKNIKNLFHTNLLIIRIIIDDII